MVSTSAEASPRQAPGNQGPHPSDRAASSGGGGADGRSSGERGGGQDDAQREHGGGPSKAGPGMGPGEPAPRRAGCLVRSGGVRVGAAAEEPAELTSVDDCAAALRALPGGDAALPQIADIVVEFHRSYVTVPGFHKHTSRKVAEWVRACKSALHHAWLQAAAAGGPGHHHHNNKNHLTSPPKSPPSRSPPPPFPARRAGLAVESCIMSGIHEAVFGSVVKWAEARDAELVGVMRWLQAGGGPGEGAMQVCGVPERLLSADLGAAAEHLAALAACRCPLEMMLCLHRANRAILAAVVEAEAEGGGEGKPDGGQAVPADDLLPLFIASLVAACPPRACSAVEYLLTFHQEGDLRGGGGYTLAMLEASVQFLGQFQAKGLVACRPPGLGPPPALLHPLPHSADGGAPLEPPPGLRLAAVDDGPPLPDPRAESLPSSRRPTLTLMGGGADEIDRASQIFYKSIRGRQLEGLLGLRLDPDASSSSSATRPPPKGTTPPIPVAWGPGGESEPSAYSADAAALSNQFPRLRIDLSPPQQDDFFLSPAPPTELPGAEGLSAPGPAPTQPACAERPPAVIPVAGGPASSTAGLGSFLSGLRSKGEAASGSRRL